MQLEADVHVTEDLIKKQLRKMPSWKSPSPDGLQAYWLKNFKSQTKNIAQQLNECLQDNSVPHWMTDGRTV